MSYIMGFVIAVPAENKQKFIEHAKLMDSYIIELGALRIVECWEVDVQDGEQTDFRRAVKAKPGEAVVFSWAEWPDKAASDAAMKKMMSGEAQDPRIDMEKNPMPFDGMRMIFGGFEPIFTIEK